MKRLAVLAIAVALGGCTRLVVLGPPDASDDFLPDAAIGFDGGPLGDAALLDGGMPLADGGLPDAP